jgi:hypothetical protein
MEIIKLENALELANGSLIEEQIENEQLRKRLNKASMEVLQIDKELHTAKSNHKYWKNRALINDAVPPIKKDLMEKSFPITSPVIKRIADRFDEDIIGGNPRHNVLSRIEDNRLDECIIGVGHQRSGEQDGKSDHFIIYDAIRLRKKMEELGIDLSVLDYNLGADQGPAVTMHPIHSEIVEGECFCGCSSYGPCNEHDCPHCSKTSIHASRRPSIDVCERCSEPSCPVECNG